MIGIENFCLQLMLFFKNNSNCNWYFFVLIDFGFWFIAQRFHCHKEGKNAFIKERFRGFLIRHTKIGGVSNKSFLKGGFFWCDIYGMSAAAALWWMVRFWSFIWLSCFIIGVLSDYEERKVKMFEFERWKNAAHHLTSIWDLAYQVPIQKMLRVVCWWHEGP